MRLRMVLLAGILAASAGSALSQDRTTMTLPDAARSAPTEALAPLSDLAAREIAAHHLPGAVILGAEGGKVVFFQAFGDRTLQPKREPMRTDTVFDLASLTKVVATAPAILRLVDEGLIDLDAPAARYWPQFGQNGKERITIRDLLTHFSGLRVGMDPRASWSGERQALDVVAADRPVAPHGSKFSYSDVDFIVLGEIVHRVSGQRLDVFCQKAIFGPLGMADTGFHPPQAVAARIAPGDDGAVTLPQDPIARRMGGVAGHAGLFGTAADLARFARMMADGGELDGVRVLSREAVRLMTTPQGPAAQPVLRGLGWDILSPFSTDHSASFPDGSYGHTGYTGTSIWIDPASRSILIVLSNRLHPDGKGQVRTLRSAAAALFAGGLGLPKPTARREAALATSKVAAAGHGQSDTPGPAPDGVRTGIDVLVDEGFAPLAGLRIGLVTNRSGRDTLGRRTVDVLAHAPGVKLAALFSPEHGLDSALDETVADAVDRITGLHVHSLYGKVKKPTPDMLRGLDAVVVDLQDVGARFYTYATTMAYVLEAAAQAHLKVFVLDRPNPIKASVVQGPVMEPALKSFIGYYPLPTRHGMTLGELARLFNGAAGIGADLHVVALRHYARDLWYDSTGLDWVNPSPNLRKLAQAVLYPGVAMVEGANVSVGRGTDTPFELVGAPWIDGPALAGALTSRAIRGVRFEAARFTPASGPFHGETCNGIRITVTDRDALDSPGLGLELVAALQSLHPGTFEIDRTVGMIGSHDIVAALKEGQDPRRVARSLAPALERFSRLRAAYLLY